MSLYRCLMLLVIMSSFGHVEAKSWMNVVFAPSCAAKPAERVIAGTWQKNGY